MGYSSESSSGGSKKQTSKQAKYGTAGGRKAQGRTQQRGWTTEGKQYNSRQWSAPQVPYLENESAYSEEGLSESVTEKQTKKGKNGHNTRHRSWKMSSIMLRLSGKKTITTHPSSAPACARLPLPTLPAGTSRFHPGLPLSVYLASRVLFVA